jgi:DNA-binding CsgD family transcriptional regulator
MTSNRNIGSIPQREREVLRLLARGHDTKSIASALGLSIHVVNERLRDSRRRLGVTSSREAARMLAAQGDDFLGNEEIGLATSPCGQPLGRRGGAEWSSRHVLIGFAMLILSAAVLTAALLTPRAAFPSTAATPPRVVATNPKAGASIAPGPFLLTVTFDQPMVRDSYSYTQTSAETFPECASRPALSPDGRTFTLRCTAAPGRHYEIWFNRPPYMNFRGLNGLSSEPHQLLFRSRAR